MGRVTTHDPSDVGGETVPVDVPPADAPPVGAPPEVGPVAVGGRTPRPLTLLLIAGLIVSLLLAMAAVRVAIGSDDETADAPPPSGPLGGLVPVLTASPTMLAAADEAAQLSRLLSAGQTSVAAPSPALALCAAVTLTEPLEVLGRWERNGQEVASTDLSTVGAPGFGDCVNDGGAELPDGTYQFLVVDPDGNESAASTLVLGEPALVQPFVNDGETAICLVRLAPRAAGYFEAYDFTTTPIGPGATINLALADVRQALQAVACGPDGQVVVDTDFVPDPSDPQPLSD